MMQFESKFESKFEFRILILDPDEESFDKLHMSALSTFGPEGEIIKENDLALMENMKVTRCATPEQIEENPGAAAWNCLFISLHFPNCFAIAQQFYQENPFCYQVFYEVPPFFNTQKLTRLLRSRPIGLLESVVDKESIREILTLAWHISEIKEGVLRLATRTRYFLISQKNILYIRSEGHKCYFYTDTYVKSVESTKEALFVHPTDSKDDIFTYEFITTLSKVEAMLPRSFLRVHQSFIVNTDYIKAVKTEKDNYTVVFEKNGISDEIPVSSKYKGVVKNWLLNGEI